MALKRSRWRALPAWVAVCMLAVMSLQPVLSAAQANPAEGHAQVIAQGVDRMPRVEVAWRLTTSEAAPADEAEFFSRTLGFTIGAGDPILVTDRDSGANTLLQDGQATFHREGAVERRASTTDADASYVNIELVVADAVATGDSLGSSSLVLASNDFTAPGGDRNLQLTGNVLAPGEEDAFSMASDVPYLLYVSEGVVEVTNEGGMSFELAAGNGGAFAGEIGIVGGASQGGTFLIASIGDEVELPPLPTAEEDETGTLELRLEACPDGLDQPCEPTTNEDVTVPAFHLVSDENWIIPDRAEVSDDGSTYTYDDLPAGDYTTGPEDNALPGIEIDGAEWSDEHQGWDFTVRANRTTDLTLKVVTGDDRGDTGSLLVTLYDCPAGVDPAVDDSACTMADQPWNVVIDNPGQSDLTTWTLFDDALDLGDGQYWFELLPAESLVFWPDDTRDAGLDGYAIAGDPYALGNIWSVDIPYHGAAEAVVYRLLPGDGPAGDPTPEPTGEPAGGTGSLVIAQIDCPYGTDISVDTSACATSTDPWEVTVTNTATGESWSMLGDGVAYDSGTYVFEALPAGTYSIVVSSNGNWSVSYPSSVDVTADDEAYVDVYSVDLRVP